MPTKRRKLGKSKHQGFSLIEILVGITILAATIIPIAQMFSNTGKQLDQNKKYSYAHLIAHSILEQIQAQSATESISEMPSYKNYHGLFADGEYPLSPHFQNFGNSNNGVNPKEFPILATELSTYRFKVTQKPVPGLENDARIREVTVEVLWNYARRAADSRLALKTIISNYETI